MRDADKLAAAIRAFAFKWGGAGDGDMVVPEETWAAWCELAGVCGATDGGRPCKLARGHTRHHSNGNRTWKGT